MRHRIRELRKKAGMTQAELAEKTGCSRQFINLLEGDEEMSIQSKRLIKIAEALGVSLNDLFLAGDVYGK